jgi:large subunit ribosomal protein L35
MAKLKTHSASKKRFRKTASGKIKRAKGFRRHHAWAKSAKKIAQLRGVHYISSADEANIARLLPYQ